MKLAGLSEKDMKANPQAGTKAMLGMALLSLIMAYVLAHLVDYIGVKTAIDAVALAFWLWLGFIVPTLGSLSLFEKRPWGLSTISGGYYLVSLVVMSLILTLWV